MKRNNWATNAITYFGVPIVLWLLSVGLVHAESNAVVAKQATTAAQYEAFAQVEPIEALPVRAQQAGMVMGMHILAGELLKAGQGIGELGGPEIQAQLSRDKAELRSAQVLLTASKKSLIFQQQQRKLQLTTKLAVFQAETTLAQAQSAFETAQARLRALHQLLMLKSPVDGRVLAVDATNGERMDVGQPILTLQPANGLWLKAVYYGADASKIQAGMTGRFVPVNGSNPLPVKVSTVFSMLAPDGGEGIGLVSMKPTPAWRNGEFGKLTLNGPERSMVAVPTRALILDQGKWWVMVRSSTGDHPQEVTPGPTRGWQTFITHGLEPGTKVVVDNAYLEFHRSISHRYQPPD